MRKFLSPIPCGSIHSIYCFKYIEMCCAGESLVLSFCCVNHRVFVILHFIFSGQVFRMVSAIGNNPKNLPTKYKKPGSENENTGSNGHGTYFLLITDRGNR